MAVGSVWFDRDAVSQDGWRPDGAKVSQRHWADMPEYFPPDADAETRNPLIYEVFEWPAPGLTTDLMVTVTVIYPGHVGGEPHHTKGHFHQDPDGHELVIGLSGSGILETGDRNGQRHAAPLVPGRFMEVPAGVAHRVLNADAEPVKYVSISGAGIGHDYASIDQLGWRPGASVPGGESRGTAAKGVAL